LINASFRVGDRYLPATVPVIHVPKPMLTTIEQTSQTERTDLHQAWSFVDRIYCLTLEHRHDRREQATEQFRNAGLGGRVEFLISQKHPTNAEHGNFIAQMKALRAGVDAGAQIIAIFEDDIILDRLTVKKLKDAARFVHSDEEWNILFLGCFVKWSRRTPWRSIIKIRFRSLTHGYIIRREFAVKLLQIPWPGRCLDDLIESMNDPGVYAVYPSIAFQSNSRTDNDKQIFNDRFRRALGGLRPLQKWNEFATLHFRLLIVVHAIILALMISGALTAHYVFKLDL
jgi:hypothetical protein